MGSSPTFGKLAPEQPSVQTDQASRPPTPRWVCLAAFILLVGLWLRVEIIRQMPSVSRDGADFCMDTMSLAHHGLAALRDERFDQHPLYPFGLLSAHAALRAIGAPDEPLLWQRAGQIISLTSGLAVMLLSAALGWRLVERLKAPVAAPSAALWAMALAAILPLNVALSADVMSDQTHLAFYLAGVLAAGGRSWSSAAGSGLFSGLAFLTRPEGAVVCAAAAAARIFGRPGPDAARGPLTRRWGATVLLCGVFLACATPYWLAIGGFSSKQGKQTVDEFAGAETPPTVVQARLARESMPWYGALPWSTYHTFRAGRVVVPLLALPALFALRREWGRRGMMALLLCGAAHFSLINLLLVRHGYLEPRHALVVVALLTPLAGMFLARFFHDAARPRLTWVAVLLAVVCFGVLWRYAVRIPNADDGFLFRAGAWLRTARPEFIGQRLLGGSSERRVAFYAGMKHQPWDEYRPTLEQRLWSLRAEIMDSGPGYEPACLAIIIGLEGDAADAGELLAALLSDPQVAGRLGWLHSEFGLQNDELRLYEVMKPPAP